MTTVFQNFNFSTNDVKIELRKQFENIDPINFQINWEKEYGNIDSDLIKLKELVSDDAYLIIIGVAGESALGSAAAVGLDKYLSAL